MNCVAMTKLQGPARMPASTFCLSLRASDLSRNCSSYGEKITTKFFLLVGILGVLTGSNFSCWYCQARRFRSGEIVITIF